MVNNKKDSMSHASMEKYCPFCDPVNVEWQKVWHLTDDSRNINIFYNIRDSNLGRLLIVPKRHVLDIGELYRVEREELFEVVDFARKILRERIGARQFNYGWNEGEYAGQSVEHMHVHILPRFPGDKHLKYHVLHTKKKHDLPKEEFEKRVAQFREYFKGYF
ncbi:HIT domain-containing protein [Candidatus Woesearchaeota archaeon]|nr:HIT domain-containing protein [Candidatus Woesearchaeota archaeon]MBW3021326.1 HIT domain-containing protein [Candidatus Woesearchaeota archaeon]